ncbi:HTH domain-containing protein [Natronoarchaeum sp. GCM10025703]|uniref:HTH domain-containing protein n=1 Tax=unclassified Natronoarchaeum TaxID=2620183 RepID=UPI00361561DB
MDRTDGPLRIEVYMRGFAPDATQQTQESTLQRLYELQESGVVDEVDVTRWSRKVCFRSGGRGGVPEEIAMYREFERALEDTDLTVDPFFRVRQGAAGRTVMFLPVLCLVLRKGEQFSGVYPCAGPDETYTVSDCLEALEEDRELDEVPGVRSEPKPV